MVELLDLWLPVVVSAVLVFFASFLSWMILPFHKKEWSRFQDEEAFFAKIRELKIPPGKYMFPYTEGKESCNDPAFLEKWKGGPHGVLQVWGRVPSFGKNLGSTFVFYLVTGVFVAYLTGHALGPGAAYGQVFRIAGTAALLGYAFATIPDAIWFQKPCGGLMATLIDGLVFALLTAGAFAGFWPSA